MKFRPHEMYAATKDQCCTIDDSNPDPAEDCYSLANDLREKDLVRYQFYKRI